MILLTNENKAEYEMVSCNFLSTKRQTFFTILCQFGYNRDFYGDTFRSDNFKLSAIIMQHDISIDLPNEIHKYYGEGFESQLWIMQIFLKSHLITSKNTW